jgi:hypothetical protein
VFEKRLVTETRSSEKDDTCGKFGIVRKELLPLRGSFGE